MGDFFSMHWDLLVGRIGGPLSFRLIIQPLVGAYLGVRAGLKDAKDGQPPFGWHLLTTRRADRNQLVQQAWKNVCKLFFAAIVIDVVYELVVLHWVYPLQALIVATILAVPTYITARGLTNRMATRRNAETGWINGCMIRSSGLARECLSDRLLP
jgi:hypothetical protein